MNKKRDLLLLIVLVLASLTCNLPFSTTSEPSQSEIDELNAMISADIELGGMSEVDGDSDGVMDNLYYTFPTYELHEGVLVTKTYAMESGGEEEFHPGIIVAFDNQSGAVQAFTFVLEVPKGFASDVAELSFSLEPAEVIEPDPILSFNVSLTPEQQVDQWLTIYSVTGLKDKDLPRAKQILMETAFGETVNYCDNTYFPKAYQKEQCYLNMAVDFKNFINKGALEPYCEMAGTTNKAGCLAIVNKDITKCQTVKERYQQENCKGFFINDLCKAEKTDEDRIICIGREAVQNKSPNACMLLPDRDMKNVCLANVYNKASYCERVEDKDLKQECQATLGGTTSSQADSGGESVKWFYPRNEKRDCQSLASLTNVYPLTRASGNTETLVCEWSDQEDKTDFNIQVYLKLFDSPEEALADWKLNHNPNEREFEVQISSAPVVKYESTETSYFYVLQKNYSDNSVDYVIGAGEVLGRGYIYFQQKYMSQIVPSIWYGTRELAQQLIGE